MRPFRRNKAVGLGLAFGRKKVRIASLEQSSSGLHMATYGEREYPEKGQDPIRGRAWEINAGVVGDLLNSLAIAKRRVVVAMPNYSCFVRNVTVPSMKFSEVIKAARYQAFSVLPLPLEDIVAEVCSIRRLADGMLEATIVAARKDEVAQLIRLVELAGLEPVGIELQALAIRRALALKQDSQVLLELENRLLTVSYFDKGLLRFSRQSALAESDTSVLLDNRPGNSQPPGSASYHYSMASDGTKDGAGFARPGAVYERRGEYDPHGGGTQEKSRVLSELDRTIDYWGRDNGKQLEVEGVVVVGSDEADIDLVAECMLMPEARRGDPWTILKPPGGSNGETKMDLGDSYLAAIGLAARRI